MSSEKVSFNISIVDLGKIHMLIDKGVYTNRTDFITKAITSELNRNEEVIRQSKKGREFAIGIIKYSRSDLESILQKNKKITIHALGLLAFDDDIDLDLAIATISKIVVFGKFVGPQAIKDYFGF